MITVHHIEKLVETFLVWCIFNEIHKKINAIN